MRLLSVLLFICFSIDAAAQGLMTAGPMIGHTELRSATLWLAHAPIQHIIVTYAPASGADTLPPSTGSRLVPGTGLRETVQSTAGKTKLTLSGGDLEQDGTEQIVLRDLLPGTVYNYELTLVRSKDKSAETRKGSFTTQSLWQWRKPAPDFSFLAGSCAYFNEPAFDRPGKPYGGDSSIFLTMAKTPADFMLWLGDNWYTRDVDYYSASGLRYRAHHDRSLPILQPLLKAMPQYAVWDDHDYGPNDFGASYVLKEESRNIFMDYWANPSYGMNGQGIYTQFAWNDVAFFLLDDRWWRSADNTKDSIGGKPNPDKTMFGKKQLDWLKDALLQSRYSSFKIIVTGSQVLNPASPYDCLFHFTAEYRELMDFIADNRINGVVFLTGDRHHSEVIRLDRPGHYPLYDITVSPLTSGASKVSGAEAGNPARVPNTLIETQNYARISISGSERGKRKLHVDFLDTMGVKITEWELNQQDATEH